MAGRIVNIAVAEGDRVAQGQLMVQLQLEREQAQVSARVSDVNAQRAALKNAEAQLSTAEAERVSAAAEVELQKRRVWAHSVLSRSRRSSWAAARPGETRSRGQRSRLSMLPRGGLKPLEPRSNKKEPHFRRHRHRERYPSKSYSTTEWLPRLPEQLGKLSPNPATT